MENRVKKNRNKISIYILELISVLVFTTCDLLSPGLGDKIDLEVPVIGIESHRNGDYIAGIVELSGYVSDDSGISSVIIMEMSTSVQS